MNFGNNKYLKKQLLLNHNHNVGVKADVVMIKLGKEREDISKSPSVLPGGKGLSSFDYSKENINSISTKTIYSPEIEKVEKEGKLKGYTDAVKLMLGRIIRCKEGVWLMPVDPYGHHLLKKPVRDTCDNKFCDCEYCIESRKIKAKNRLERYPLFRKYEKEKGYRKKQEKAVHLEIAFNRVFKNTDEELLKAKIEIEREFKNIRKDFKRRKFKLIGAVAYDVKVVEKRGLIYFLLHFHLALYPPKLYKTFEKVCGDLTQKYKGIAIIKNEGLKPKDSLKNYFIKVVAGLISTNVNDEVKHHTALYKEVMTPETYLKVFLHKQILRYVGYDKGRDVLCVSHAERSEGVDNLYRLGQRLPEKCPVCGWIVVNEGIKIKKLKSNEKPPDKIFKNRYVKQVWISRNSYTEQEITII